LKGHDNEEARLKKTRKKTKKKTQKKSGQKSEVKSTRFLQYTRAISDLDVFVQIALFGLSVPAKRRDFLNKMRAIYVDFGEDFGDESLTDKDLFKKKLDRMSKHEKFAKAQIKQGFPYIYEMAVVRLWSILEAMSDDIVLYLLVNFPEVYGDILGKLKGPLLDFHQATKSERAAILLEILKDKVSSRLQQGVGRFESLFKTINFGGPVHDKIRRLLFELSEVRHIVIHRNGKADAKIVKRCPWLGLRVGQKLQTTSKHYHDYSVGAGCYVLELALRWQLSGPGFSNLSNPDRWCKKTAATLDELDAKLPN